MNNHLIEMKNIHKTYLGSIQVLKDLSFICEKGDFIAILGKSGSGKTTLMNIIGQLDTDYEGEYFFDGVDLRKRTSQFIGKDIAFIFQNYQLIEHLTVFENVYLPYVYTQYDDKEICMKVMNVLSQLGIEALKDKRIHTLSGGEKQRVAIARSLLMNVKLMIADEPTGNLDAENEKIVMECLKKITELGTTVILITHNQALVQYSDDCYELRDGKLYEKV